MSSDRIADFAAQPERTLLAWRRTILSAAAGMAVAFRLAVPTVWLAVPLAAIGLVLIAIAWIGATRRYRRLYAEFAEDAVLHDGLPIHTGGAAHLAAVAGAAVLISVLVLVAVIAESVLPTT